MRNRAGLQIIVIYALLVSINLIVRFLIYFNTELFYFNDYAGYLIGIERIARGENVYLLEGNFLGAISYIGYFAKIIMGSIDYFFVFNCMLATGTSLLVAMGVSSFTGSKRAGIITMILLTIYTEYMVFSSVFYTPVLMIFLLALFLGVLTYYYGRQDGFFCYCYP